jgi:predicted nuclease of predicted toxin-antitoxin system
VKLWLDAQLPPGLAPWLASTFSVRCTPVRDLHLRNATDLQIFMSAREAGAVLVSKDADFLGLLEQHGPPPQVIWVTCGNTSNARLQAVIRASWPHIVTLLEAGEPLVELSGR